jgi:hypothetical protein
VTKKTKYPSCHSARNFPINTHQQKKDASSMTKKPPKPSKSHQKSLKTPKNPMSLFNKLYLKAYTIIHATSPKLITAN